MYFVDIFTFLCVLCGVISAALVAFHPNILYAAIALIFSLLSVAGIYGVLGADFLAAVQLIIYVGAIIVVIMFAIMMSEDIYRNRFIASLKGLVIPAGISALVLGGLVALILKTPWQAVPELSRVATTAAMGRALLGPYALAFEYVAVVLLAGLIGAVIVARPDHQRSHKKDGV